MLFAGLDQIAAAARLMARSHFLLSDLIFEINLSLQVLYNRFHRVDLISQFEVLPLQVYLLLIQSFHILGLSIDIRHQ